MTKIFLLITFLLIIIATAFLVTRKTADSVIKEIELLPSNKQQDISTYLRDNHFEFGVYNKQTISEFSQFTFDCPQSVKNIYDHGIVALLRDRENISWWGVQLFVYFDKNDRLIFIHGEETTSF